MTRPETVDDLTPDQRRGPEFASFDLGAFPINGGLLRAAAKFLDYASNQPLLALRLRVGTRVNFYATPSVGDLKAGLDIAQRNWDSMHGRWLAAKSGAPRDALGYAIEQWCAREGLDQPWSAVAE